MSDEKLIYPTVNLFLYDIRDGLGQSVRDIESNRKKFWRKFDSELNQQLRELGSLAAANDPLQQTQLAIVKSPLENKLAELEQKENSEADYVQLYAKKFAEDTPNLDGFYFALQFSDTYSLQVNCSGSSEVNQHPQPLEQLTENQHAILKRLNPISEQPEQNQTPCGTLGQTWFVWGQLTHEKQDFETIAKSCCEKLIPDSNWKIKLEEIGKFHSATLFEVWRIPTNWGQNWEKFSQETYHLVICLFPSQQNPKELLEIQTKITSIYLDLTRLFLYRHKVLWSYWQSRRLKAELKQKSANVQQQIDIIRKLDGQIKNSTLNLKELQLTLNDALPLLADYTIKLNNLTAQGRTMKVNLENYRKRLNLIETKTESNLTGFQDFYNFTSEKYLQQIEDDQANLSPELTLLENLISTLRGIIDVEQTKSDRNLNMTIGVVGSAIGLTGAIASSLSAVDPKPKSYTDFSFLTTPVFLFSVFPIFMAILLLGIRRFRR